MNELSCRTDMAFGTPPARRGASAAPVPRATVTVRNSRRVCMTSSPVVWISCRARAGATLGEGARVCQGGVEEALRSAAAPLVSHQRPAGGPEILCDIALAPVAPSLVGCHRFLPLAAPDHPPVENHVDDVVREHMLE